MNGVISHPEPTVISALRALGELLASRGEYAAADSAGPSSVHFQDLIALKPTDEELDAAEKWVRSQDTSPAFGHILDQVVRHAKQHR